MKICIFSQHYTAHFSQAFHILMQFLSALPLCPFLCSLLFLFFFFCPTNRMWPRCVNLLCWLDYKYNRVMISFLLLKTVVTGTKLAIFVWALFEYLHFISPLGTPGLLVLPACFKQWMSLFPCKMNESAYFCCQSVCVQWASIQDVLLMRMLMRPITVVTEILTVS